MTVEQVEQVEQILLHNPQFGLTIEQIDNWVKKEIIGFPVLLPDGKIEIRVD